MKLWLIAAITLSIGVQAGTRFQFITLCFYVHTLSVCISLFLRLLTIYNP